MTFGFVGLCVGLNEVRQLIERGHHKAVLAMIDEATSDANTEPEVKLAFEVLRAKALMEIGSLDDATLAAQVTANEAKKEGFQLIAVEALIEEGEALRRKGEIAEAQLIVDEAEALISEMPEMPAVTRTHRLAAIARLHGLICWDRGNLDEALSYLDQTRNLHQSLGRSRHLASALNNMGIVLLEKGKSKAALAHFEESLAIFTETGRTLDQARLLSNLGEICKFSGDVAGAISYYEESMLRIQEGGHTPQLEVAYTNLGESYQMLGELHVGIAYFRRAFAIAQQFGNQAGVALLFCNIGSIHEALGELHFALSHYMQGLVMMQRMGIEREIALPLHRIGVVHWKLGKIDSAKGYVMRSLEYREKAGRSLHIAACLHDLVSMLGDNGEMSEAEAFLQRMEELCDAQTNSPVNKYYRLTLAGFLKNKKRTKEMARAQAVLSDLLAEGELRHPLKVKAMLGLFELLLIEIRGTGNQEAFEEIKALSTRLVATAKSSRSHSLLAETYLLNAQLALIEFDTNKADRLLNKAEHLATESGLRSLSTRIRELHSRVSSSPELWNEMHSRGASLAERMESTILEETLLRMVGGSFSDQASVPREKPILLLVLAHSGIPLHVKHFVHTESATANDHLIAGFLTAMHSLSKDAFRTSGGMTHIKQNMHTLIIYANEPLLFCYAIQGSAFAAQERLRNFVEMLVSSPVVWDTLTGHVPALSESQTRGIDHIIKLAFDPSSLEHAGKQLTPNPQKVT